MQMSSSKFGLKYSFTISFYIANMYVVYVSRKVTWHMYIIIYREILQGDKTV